MVLFMYIQCYNRYSLSLHEINLIGQIIHIGWFYHQEKYSYKTSNHIIKKNTRKVNKYTDAEFCVFSGNAQIITIPMPILK